MLWNGIKSFSNLMARNGKGLIDRNVSGLVLKTIPIKGTRIQISSGLEIKTKTQAKSIDVSFKKVPSNASVIDPITNDRLIAHQYIPLPEGAKDSLLGLHVFFDKVSTSTPNNKHRCQSYIRLDTMTSNEGVFTSKDGLLKAQLVEVDTQD